MIAALRARLPELRRPARRWLAGLPLALLGTGLALSGPATSTATPEPAAATAANPRWRQRAFAATAVSSVCWVAGGLVWWRMGWRNLWGPRPTVMLPVTAAASSAMLFQRFVAATPTTPAPPDSAAEAVAA